MLTGSCVRVSIVGTTTHYPSSLRRCVNRQLCIIPACGLARRCLGQMCPPTWECNFLMSAVSEHPFTKFYEKWKIFTPENIHCWKYSPLKILCQPSVKNIHLPNFICSWVRIQGVDKCSQKQETEKEEDFHVSTEDTPVITKQFKNIISRSQILIKIVLLILKELILKFMISQKIERAGSLIFDNGPTFPEWQCPEVETSDDNGQTQLLTLVN